MQNRKIILGSLFAITATLIWSGNFIIARGLSDVIPPVSLAFWRWLTAIVVFLPFSYKKLMAQREIIKKNIKFLSIISLLGVTVFNTLIYTAGHTTTAINLSLISISFPIFIIILMRLIHGEVITKGKGGGIILVIFGVVALISKGDFSRLLDLSFAIGDLWMVLASFIFALYSVLLKQKPKELSISALQAATFIIGLVFLLPFYLWEYAHTDTYEISFRTVSAILYVGIFASLSAFILWHKAIEMIGPSRAGMIYYTLPIFSGFLAYLFLNETIGGVHLISALLIIFGILLANYGSKSDK